MVEDNKKAFDVVFYLNVVGCKALGACVGYLFGGWFYLNVVGCKVSYLEENYTGFEVLSERSGM